MSEETWGWYAEGAHAHGPFDSQEAATADAIGYFAGDKPGSHKVTVGPCVDIRPENWIWADMDAVLERMDESLGEHVEIDDVCFVVDPEKHEAAEADLQAALRAWAKRWVSAQVHWYVGDGKEINVP